MFLFKSNCVFDENEYDEYEYGEELGLDGGSKSE